MSPEILYVVIAFLATGLGYFLKSYFSEKGKNYATREDIAQILDQLRRTTKATEEIRAQISSEVWIQQTRWNLKRELYTRLLENLSLAKEIMARISGLEETLFRTITVAQEKELEERIKPLRERESGAIGEIRRATAVAAIFLSNEAIEALEKLQSDWSKASRAEDYFEVMHERVASCDRASKLLVAAAKADLLGLAKTEETE